MVGGIFGEKNWMFKLMIYKIFEVNICTLFVLIDFQFIFFNKKEDRYLQSKKKVHFCQVDFL